MTSVSSSEWRVGRLSDYRALPGFVSSLVLLLEFVAKSLGECLEQRPINQALCFEVFVELGSNTIFASSTGPLETCGRRSKTSPKQIAQKAICTIYEVRFFHFWPKFA